MVPIELKNAEEASKLAGRIAAAKEKAALPSHARAAILNKAADALEKDKEALAQLLAEEVGKPLKAGRVEVARMLFTLRWSAEEARRIGGELMPLDLSAGEDGRVALIKRVPRGPALFITPFNFPLNLVAHKVAPAVAVGLPFVLKPDPRCPKAASRLLGALVDAGWPKDACAIALGPLPAMEALVADERFKIFSFTGSTAVGWKLKALAVKAQTCLELGGNAAVFVAKDADLPWAAARCAAGGYAYAGQTCIHVQRVYVENEALPEFRKLLVANIKELVAGDPKDEKTDVGPVIDEKSAARIESWLKEAVSAGGKLWAGGERKGLLIPPALVEGVPPSCTLMKEEVFGPVVTLEGVASKEEALEKMNDSRYGLQAGIFTNDLAFVQRAFARLDYGGVIVNDIPSFRSDAMPYGGVKDSGVGREGVRSTIEEYTEPKTLVLKS